MTTAVETGTAHVATPAGDPPQLRYFVYALFFIFGGITSLNDVLIPKLKDLFTLSYAEVMLVQSAFFTAYFLISIPASAVLRKVGYMRAATLGLLTMAAGCLLFIPASTTALFPVFLFALFVLASGITVVQVVANPLISRLGPAATAHSRLTFAHSFNSIGTTIFPYVGSIVILGALSTIDPTTLDPIARSAYRTRETHVVMVSYLALALAIGIVASFVWMWRKRLVEGPVDRVSFFGALDLLRRPRFAVGALCIFLYVGAEVAIGSIIVSYLMQADVLSLGQRAAGEHVPFYWGGAMVGRFVGTALLRVVSPGKLLAFAGGVAMLLLLVSANTTGAISAWSLLSIGLFNSIMFPTVFALASEGLGVRAPEGSGVIATAIVGGAVVPLLMGAAADGAGLKLALVVPALCYAVIAGYGLYTRRSAATVDATAH
jgi:FHS family L-fucose permease-like MFS transporter